MNVQELNEFFKELEKINKQVEEDFYKYGKKYDGRGKEGIWEEDEGSKGKEEGNWNWNKERNLWGQDN